MSHLFCPECANKYKTLTFCPECSVPLSSSTTPQMRQHIKGNDNQTIQIGGDNAGDIVIQHAPVQDGPLATIQRETITPLRIGNTPIKNWWLFVSGALPIVAKLLTIVNTWQGGLTAAIASTPHPYTHLLMYATFIGLIPLITAIMLHRIGYRTLPFGRTFEIDKRGDLYLTRIGGTCGLCGSPVRVKTVGPIDARQTRVICTNNPDQHQWAFDRTVLGDVGEDYRSRQQGI